MFKKHQHIWETHSTHFTPPQQEATVKNGTYQLAKDLTEGVTHIYLKCKVCGDITERRVNGKFEEAIR